MICVIAGGGEARFPDTKDAFVIAADSGYNRCVENNIAPDLLVGDMDSIKGSVPDASDIPIVRAPCEKDDTDTMLAIKIGFERGYRDFVLTGVQAEKGLTTRLPPYPPLNISQITAARAASSTAAARCSCRPRAQGDTRAGERGISPCFP